MESICDITPLPPPPLSRVAPGAHKNVIVLDDVVAVVLEGPGGRMNQDEARDLTDRGEAVRGEDRGEAE